MNSAHPGWPYSLEYNNTVFRPRPAFWAKRNSVVSSTRAAYSWGGEPMETTGRMWFARAEIGAPTKYSVCWAPELNTYCAVAAFGTGNRVSLSPNGVKWNSIKTPRDNSWYSVCYSSQLRLLCAVSEGGPNQAMVSQDGVNWFLGNLAGSQFYSVCWSPELGLFCAVGFNRVSTSPDGLNWTNRTAAAFNTWWGVCWSPELGLFCAVGQGGNNDRVMTSPDGITWTARTSAANANWSSVCWSPELRLFCAMANGTNGTDTTIMNSPDGINWTKVASVFAGSHVCWCKELQVFMSIGGFSSKDGTRWERYFTEFSLSGNSICWSPQLRQFCSVGIFGMTTSL